MEEEMTRRFPRRKAGPAIALVAALISAAMFLSAAESPGQGKGDASGGPRPKPDLSKPASAFKSFSRDLDLLVTVSMKEVQEALSAGEAAQFSEALTPAFADYLRRKEASRPGESPQAAAPGLGYLKEKKGDDGLVTVFAVQAPPSGGKAEPGPKTPGMRSMIVYEMEGGEYRIREWLEECPACSGTGACPACGGTGSAKASACPGCGGQGRTPDGKSCDACKGKGVVSQACPSCERSPGACRRCSGSGGQRRDLFETSGLVGEIDLKEDKYRDLSTPENAVRTYLCIEREIEAARCRAAAKFTVALRRMIEAYFSRETLALFDSAVKKSTEDMKSSLLGIRREVGKAKAADGAEIVEAAAESRDLYGEAHRELRYFKVVRKDGGFRIADRAEMCADCMGGGDCLSCGGTGEKAGKPCPDCAGLPGKCPKCGGFRYQWERKARD